MTRYFCHLLGAQFNQCLSDPVEATFPKQAAMMYAKRLQDAGVTIPTPAQVRVEKAHGVFSRLYDVYPSTTSRSKFRVVCPGWPSNSEQR